MLSSVLTLFSVLYDADVQAAPEVCPVTVSGMVKIPDLLNTCSCLFAESHALTSAVTFELPPATISPIVKSPVPPTAKLTVMALANAVSIASISVMPVSRSSSLYSKSSH